MYFSIKINKRNVHEITEDKYEIKDIPISNIVVLEEYIEIL